MENNQDNFNNLLPYDENEEYIDIGTYNQEYEEYVDIGTYNQEYDQNEFFLEKTPFSEINPNFEYIDITSINENNTAITTFEGYDESCENNIENNKIDQTNQIYDDNNNNNNNNNNIDNNNNNIDNNNNILMRFENQIYKLIQKNTFIELAIDQKLLFQLCNDKCIIENKPYHIYSQEYNYDIANQLNDHDSILLYKSSIIIDNKIHILYFQLPTLLYTNEMVVTNCWGKSQYKCKIYNSSYCSTCSKINLNLLSKYRKNNPIYKQISIEELCEIDEKDILNCQYMVLDNPTFEDKQFMLYQKTFETKILKEQNDKLIKEIEINKKQIEENEKRILMLQNEIGIGKIIINNE